VPTVEDAAVLQRHHHVEHAEVKIGGKDSLSTLSLSDTGSTG
jgi:hypothetical protein